MMQKGVKSYRVRSLAVVFLTVALAPNVAHAQATIKVNDNVSIRFGALLQGWLDSQQVSTATQNGYSQNLFLRRMRILIGGTVTPNISFFFETDNPNLGRAVSAAAPKSLGTGFITQDAFLEWKPKSNAFMLDVGLLLPPFCRNCVESAATLMTLDYGTYSFTESAATQSSVGRDTGVQAKGYLAGGHFEYRAALLSGFRQPSSGTRVIAGNSLRTTGRIMYNFLDTEAPSYTWAGVYLGNKRVFNIGGGFDHQGDYQAFSADAFAALPFAKNELNSELTILSFDGGGFLAIPDQRDFTWQLGYYLAGLKVMPFGRLEKRDNRGTNAGDENRQQIGLGWYPNGHNFNIKAAYSRVDPRIGNATNEYTVQLQFFYY